MTNVPIHVYKCGGCGRFYATAEGISPEFEKAPPCLAECGNWELVVESSVEVVATSEDAA